MVCGLSVLSLGQQQTRRPRLARPHSGARPRGSIRRGGGRVPAAPLSSVPRERLLPPPPVLPFATPTVPSFFLSFLFVSGSCIHTRTALPSSLSTTSLLPPPSRRRRWSLWRWWRSAAAAAELHPPLSLFFPLSVTPPPLLPSSFPKLNKTTPNTHTLPSKGPLLAPPTAPFSSTFAFFFGLRCFCWRPVPPPPPPPPVCFLQRGARAQRAALQAGERREAH